eukprot:m.51834 g.51834  ORF g.51834 m.51834 type:complete len:352 (+) comp16470_c0_seq1:41-1096(+)
MGDGAALDRLMFDPFRFSEAVRASSDDCPLQAAGQHIFHQHGFTKHFDLDYNALDVFLRSIETMMPPNPYHNRTHVLDVLQSVHALLLTSRLARLVPPEMKLACLLAACIHDVEHRGVSNDFLVTIRDEWATEAHSAGPNEIHHAKVGVQLLSDERCRVLARVDPSVVEHVMATVRHLVLDTDMSRHKQTVDHLTELAKAAPFDETMAKSDALMSVLSGLIKIADLGHSWTLNAVHVRWVHNLEAEFFQMGDQERARGLPISMLCDRSTPSLQAGQVGFFDYVLLPLFSAFAELVPECAAVVYQAGQNRDSWVKPEPPLPSTELKLSTSTKWATGLAVGAAVLAMFAMKRR